MVSRERADRAPARDPRLRSGAARHVRRWPETVGPVIARRRGVRARLAHLLASLAPIQRGELTTVVLLTINVFVLLTCYYVLKVVREPLILLGGGAELKAYASAGQTLLLLAVVPAFGWLSSRVSRLRLLTTIQLVFIGCLLAFYVLVQARAPIGLAFYLWLGIFSVLVVSNFWSFAADLYTPERGKRLFATIGIGASIGAVLGAFVPQLLHRVMGTSALLVVAAGGLAVSIVLYRLIDHRERSHRVKLARPTSAEVDPDRRGGFALVIKDRYLRLLAVMLLVATIINTTGEYVVGKMATDRSEVYAAEQAVASPVATTPDARAAATHDAQDEYIGRFYSNYYTIVNLVSALLQGLVVAWLLTALGIRRALFIMPLVVLVGWFGLLVFANLTMVRIEKTSENSLDYSLHNTLRGALFLPTTRAAKYRAKAFLLVRVLGLGIQAFAALNVCLAVCWLVLAYRTGRMYDEMVADHVEPEAHPGRIAA
ncbi:MAG: MFS transporter [Deltaproteobacteria bacterium]|nr:MAG: MFS transporter [Deltaproteobacteria bacterium]